MSKFVEVQRVRLSAGVVRAARIATISVVVLFLFAFAHLQFQQYKLRRQNELLLADFHSIRLNQTTWTEAQKLIQRWGKQGHAHGPSSSADCAYDITITDWPSLLPNGTAARWLYRGRFLPMFLQYVGLRFSVLDLRFLIEDGVVRRTYFSIEAETQDAGYMSALLVKVSSHASFDGSVGALSTVGADEELGVHPDFVVGSDGFCTGCETISLDYTPHIRPDVLVRLTSFDLSCLTRNLPCLHLSKLAPALMREDAGKKRDVPRNSVPCTTPAWALARDAKAIWLVDALSAAKVLDPNPLYGERPSLVEQDQVRLVTILKGPFRIPPQTTLLFYPYSGVEYEARAVPEHLNQGHRYILLPSADDGWQDRWLKEGAQAWRCGVLDDTAENELAIKQGIAMGDHLRAPELTEPWP